MSVSPQDVKLIAPELAGQTNPRIQFFIDLAVTNVNANVWVEKTDQAVTLLTAHFMTLSNRGGSGGAITSERVGDLATSYSAPSGDMSELGQTAYGQMFVTLMKTLPISPRVTGCL